MSGAAGPGANLSALRSHNAALVLRLLRDAGEDGVSRLELAGRTGLTPQAVSKITARLRAEGLAAEAGQRASTGGKPPTALRLIPGARHAIGLHLDRDELTAVLVDLAGTPVAARTAPFDFGAAADEAMAAATAEVRALLADAGAGGTESGGAAGGGAGGAGEAGGAAGGVAGGLAGGGNGGPAGGVTGGAAHAGTAGSGGGVTGGAAGGGTGGADTAGTGRAAGGAAAGGTGGRAGGGAGDPDSAGTTGTTGTAGPAGGGGLLGVGVAAPGPLDHGSGVLHRVTGFPQWDGFPLRDALAERLALPVVLDKDTNAAALGLATAGTTESAAYLHLGTGLGAGLVLGGDVYRGARTDAGEFGHQVIQLDGPPCGCGNHGCLEALCLAAVARGDRKDAARLLGIGAANLVRLLDIDRVLLGGRVVLADPEPYVRGVAALIAEDSARASRPTVPVDVVERGGRAVVEGAARLVLAPLFALG
ncbi:ROK family transcriptional regulator [Streptomyces sp. DR7-3]|uniref:ROK family transcriptional regulator n=1 Tax=Streptomyces malaysiensis TaxID=92644 RepID=UPI002043F4AE|nr:ROK family protein [Streptomyces sp. DR7-3]MCM3809978.1 ROK family transcriptional regulator [Streptomyces sp. DR7-3]